MLWSFFKITCRRIFGNRGVVNSLTLLGFMFPLPNILPKEFGVKECGMEEEAFFVLYEGFLFCGSIKCCIKFNSNLFFNVKCFIIDKIFRTSFSIPHFLTTLITLNSLNLTLSGRTNENHPAL